MKIQNLTRGGGSYKDVMVLNPIKLDVSPCMTPSGTVLLFGFEKTEAEIPLRRSTCGLIRCIPLRTFNTT